MMSSIQPLSKVVKCVIPIEEEVKQAKEKPKGNWDVSIRNELIVKISKSSLSPCLSSIPEE